MSFLKPKQSSSLDGSGKNIVEVYEDKESSFKPEAYGPSFDDSRTAQLLRKMDFNIVPFLALLYL
jgi:hypothetical protein